jgi:hypothetical protein
LILVIMFISCCYLVAEILFARPLELSHSS